MYWVYIYSKLSLNVIFQVFSKLLNLNGAKRNFSLNER